MVYRTLWLGLWFIGNIFAGKSSYYIEVYLTNLHSHMHIFTVLIYSLCCLCTQHRLKWWVIHQHKAWTMREMCSRLCTMCTWYKQKLLHWFITRSEIWFKVKCASANMACVKLSKYVCLILIPLHVVML